MADARGAAEGEEVLGATSENSGEFVAPSVLGCSDLAFWGLGWCWSSWASQGPTISNQKASQEKSTQGTGAAPARAPGGVGAACAGATATPCTVPGSAAQAPSMRRRWSHDSPGQRNMRYMAKLRLWVSKMPELNSCPERSRASEWFQHPRWPGSLFAQSMSSWSALVRPLSPCFKRSGFSWMSRTICSSSRRSRMSWLMPVSAVASSFSGGSCPAVGSRSSGVWS